MQLRPLICNAKIGNSRHRLWRVNNKPAHQVPAYCSSPNLPKWLAARLDCITDKRTDWKFWVWNNGHSLEQPGPATWQAGDYPEQQGDFPRIRDQLV